jgi:hypothetical protein
VQLFTVQADPGSPQLHPVNPTLILWQSDVRRHDGTLNSGVYELRRNGVGGRPPSRE